MNDGTHGWLVEITRVGTWRRVAVLDPVSGAEAVVHAPVDVAEEALIRLAKRRLQPRRGRPRRPDRSGFFV
ncbi:MAG: DUF6898 family protein [Alphaproteobacteria bacterium]